MKSQWKTVTGTKRGSIQLYALSTCGWCKKTKKYLNTLGVEYSYIDTDTLQGEEREKVRAELSKWNPNCTYPTLVINNQACVVGSDHDRIKELLGL